MSIEVLISKQCHCVIKHGLNKEIHCENKEEAMREAQDLLKKISSKSCETHLFFIKEEDNKIIIDSKYNPDKMF
ncbi:hypothetical protein A9Q76_07340 [Arcobacter sp. 31_11_sub10_T18]|nr:hypothetical protein A9Q76_07340 [Arcobacter sp. 31_11_sub10_T18]